MPVGLADHCVFGEVSSYFFNCLGGGKGKGHGRLFEFQWEWEGSGVGMGAYSRLGAC